MREQIIALVEKYLPSALRPGASGNVITKCPFHKGGEERKPSFSVNVELGLFHCFTCHTAGDIKYMLRLLGVPRSTIDIEIAPIQPLLDANRQHLKFERENAFSHSDPFKAKHVLPEAMLGVFEWCPTKLLEAGFDMRLLQDMEVGFDQNQQRITYPLRDMYGNLAGVSGGATLPTQQPKYLVYKGRHPDAAGKWRDGHFGKWFDEMFPGYTCENHDLIWNFHRVYPRVWGSVSGSDDTTVAVEGFKACLWTIQSGFMNTLALMGSYVSENQQRMLHRLGGQIILCFDNDDAGREATKRIGKLLLKPCHGRIQVARYPDEDVAASLSGEADSQPDDYEPDGVRWMIQNRLSYYDYLRLAEDLSDKYRPNPEKRKKVPYGTQHLPS